MIGQPLSEVLQLTLRQLLVIYESHLLEKWDYTATIAAGQHNLIAMVHNIFSKKNIPMKTPLECHPYRRSEKRGMRITADNIGVLKTVASATTRRR